ncbi:hypothetical protein GBAR_LOCUS19678 [Geodia barretti]|uniref:Uncharacterized protein n=1 Tax=Geodia barretti TaxID=519541 RepID=A0AA35WW61_GEOBA|nr:hypothetical protein GBAR_LOCUS19678 [Geodia barretti]
MGNINSSPGVRSYNGSNVQDHGRTGTVQPTRRANGTVEVTVHYQQSLQDCPSTNFTEAGFDSLLLTLRERYPTYNVMLRVKAVNEYRKTLPFKNSGIASPATIKPDVAFYVRPFPSMQNEVKSLLQSHLDPGNICR